jgi:hypothetical protein
MTRISIELDDATAERLGHLAHREGVSLAEWVRKTLSRDFAGPLPESFFEVLGTWEDSRDAGEILADIRRDTRDQGRQPLG